MPGVKSDQRGYRFNGFTLDLDRGALLEGDREIPLRPKSFDVLVYLVRNRGRLITREELLQTLWAEVVVTPDSVAQCLVDIRRALADTDGETVRTVPRRGVIFEPAVERLGRAGSASQKRRRRWLATALSLAIVAIALLTIYNRSSPTDESARPPAQPYSIAVLAFEDLNTVEEEGWIADSLAEEILSALAQVPQLRITARTSSFSLRNQDLDVTEIARRLNVAFVVEGSVHRLDERLRVTTQLVNGDTGVTLWSRQFELGPDELPSVRRSIVRRIVKQVLPDADPEIAELSSPDPTAAELLWLARRYERDVRAREDVDLTGLDRAIQLYRRAIEADPESTVALSRLADALLWRGELEAAEAPIYRALTLNPDSSEVQNTLGLFYWARGLPEAGVAFERAVELNPSNPDALSNLAGWRWFNIQTDGVADLFRRALETDPLSLDRYGALGSFLAGRGRYGEARELARRVEELFDGAAAYRIIASLDQATGDVDHAIAWTYRAQALEPENPSHTAYLAELYADVGDHERALTLEAEPGVGLLFKMRRYDDLIELGEELLLEMPEDRALRYLLAFGYYAKGRFEAAVRILESTGLPESVTERVWRDPRDADGLLILTQTLSEMGRMEEAQELARWFVYDLGSTEDADWWVSAMDACIWSILGKDQEALRALERMPQGRRLPWDPYLYDLRCLDRFRDHPSYLAATKHFEDRREQLRRQLPATLIELGVNH